MGSGDIGSFAITRRHKIAVGINVDATSPECFRSDSSCDIALPAPSQVTGAPLIISIKDFISPRSRNSHLLRTVSEEYPWTYGGIESEAETRLSRRNIALMTLRITAWNILVISVEESGYQQVKNDDASCRRRRQNTN